MESTEKTSKNRLGMSTTIHPIVQTISSKAQKFRLSESFTNNDLSMSFVFGYRILLHVAGSINSVSNCFLKQEVHIAKDLPCQHHASVQHQFELVYLQ